MLVFSLSFYHSKKDSGIRCRVGTMQWPPILPRTHLSSELLSQCFPFCLPPEPSHIPGRLCGTHWFGEYMNGWKNNIWKSSPKWHWVYDTECDYKTENSAREGWLNIYTQQCPTFDTGKKSKEVKVSPKATKKIIQGCDGQFCRKIQGDETVTSP